MYSNNGEVRMVVPDRKKEGLLFCDVGSVPYAVELNIGQYNTHSTLVNQRMKRGTYWYRNI